MKEKELQFECRKCGHNLFVDEKKGWVKKVMADCPNCGEESEGNWVLLGYGNFEQFFDH